MLSKGVGRCLSVLFFCASPANAAVVTYSISGSFQGGFLDGGQFEIRATADSGDFPDSSGISTVTFSDYLIDPVSLRISGTIADDGVYFDQAVNSRVLLNIDPTRGGINSFSMNTGYDLPSLSGFRLINTILFPPNYFQTAGNVIFLPDEVLSTDPSGANGSIFPGNTGVSLRNLSFQTIPEPSAILLIGVSSLLVFSVRRRR